MIRHHISIAQVVIRTESDIGSDTRLVLIKSTSNLLATLLLHLQLLLLCEIKLVDSGIALI